MSRQGGLTPRQEPRMSTPTYTPHPNGSFPETPDASKTYEPPTQPPQPPKIRIKRRRPVFAPRPEQMASSSDDLPLPTIEFSDSTLDTSPPMINPHSGLRLGLLASSSASSLARLMSPPKTPIQQIFSGIDGHDTTDQDCEAPYMPGEEIERPASALSVFSDSSTSSASSSDTAPSFEESCTSPDSELSDPFWLQDTSSKLPQSSSSSKGQHHSTTPRKHKKMRQNVKWTTAMDEHLWVTYTAYLSDPTVTPFKTLPGSAPPLGVCHRVAREAKKSWKARGPLHMLSENPSAYRFNPLVTHILRESSAPPRTSIVEDSPDTLRPTQTSQRSHSSSEVSRKSVARWPRSRASTRRRLRELCKFKPILPPHYQRLMQTRTPSPFEPSSSKPPRRSSRLNSQTSSADHESTFSTRDLNISLGTSTATTMQPGGLLSQLASSDHTSPETGIPTANQSSVRGAHQKSQSLQFGLGLGLGLDKNGTGSMRVLASPFEEIPKREDRHHHQPETGRLAADRESESESGHESPATVKADSPLQIHAPRPMSGSMKRRAEYQLGDEQIADDVDVRRNFLEDLFRNDVSDGHRRVRSRGFSMGAMRQASQPTRHLSELFTPPSVLEQPEVPAIFEQLGAEHKSTTQAEHNHVNLDEDNTLAPPTSAHHARRLGSPFAPTSNTGLSNTFPRSLLPHGLDSISGREHFPRTHEEHHG